MFDDWHVLELYFDTSKNHATLIGKYWIALFLLLRFVILVVFAGDAFDTESDKIDPFECDTETPGCELMCMNHFYPIIPTDYWALEMIFVSLPLCIALTYISHKTEKVEKARKYLAKEKKKQIEQEKKRIEADRKTLARKRNIYEAWLAPDGQELTNQQVEDLLSAKEAELDKQDEAEGEDDEGDEKATHGATPKLYLTYVTMVCARWLLEIAFLVGYFHIYVFQLTVPSAYRCDRRPCNEIVTCYIDRAEQKTVAIHIMVTTSMVSIMIGLIEIVALFTRKGANGNSEFSNALANRHLDITKDAQKLKTIQFKIK